MASFTIALSARELMAKARELTGIIDIIDSEIEEALSVLLKSLNTQSELSAAGAEGMQQRLLNLLCNRLRMKRDFRAHPEIDEQEIIAPLIISGVPRTGSTKLHKMLAASGDFKYMTFWQGYSMSLRSGKRDEDPAARIRDADEHVRWFNQQSPEARLTHEFSTFEVEEESLVWEHSFYSNYPQAFSFVPDYLQWWFVQDVYRKVEFIKQGLKYLQWQFYDGDTRPWIMKCPMYPGMEPVLAGAFPDATFVTTHRRVSDVISSGASLLFSYHKVYSDADRREILGPALLGGMAMIVDKYMKGRDAHPELNFVDAGYAAISKQAEQVIEKIYAAMGMSMSSEARWKMQDWEKNNQQHKHGVHKHAPEYSGLTDAAISEAFRSYIDRYGRFFNALTSDLEVM